MAYRIRYKKRAREEADHLRETYGPEFAAEFDKWQRFLAEAAEQGTDDGSVDAFEFLHDLQDQEKPSSQWDYSWEQFRKADGYAKLQALVAVLKERCPPWEFRMSSNWFKLLDFIPHEVQAYYAIDRPQSCVIFHLFELADSETERVHE